MIRRMMQSAAIASAVLVICGLVLLSLAQSQGADPIARASFNADGSVNFPTGYRNWTHVGTRLKPMGINILDGLPTKTPEILNSYVEPGAFAVHETTGNWPDGTQIVKEFSAVQVGAGCDAKTLLCTNSLGTGIFETGYIGLGMMVKDAKRFPDAAGHWGYFSFGHKPPPYDTTSAVRGRQQCQSCHIGLAADSDYVVNRAHIGLVR